ncbi:MAG: type II toxin-antitoxin system VapB family antitoxin [Alphaproteobacteria bacterium]|nr:MAG: type II toxin-antitoxin system VapB family antitoxin [Alphaproteobacteria bacterium]
MRTTLHIDDELIRKAMAVSGVSTKRGVVDLALREMVRVRLQADVRQYRGKLLWEGDLEAMRTDS